FAPQQSVRAQAIRGDRAAIEFRGFPPKTRDELKEALGDRLTVQESDWNCVLLLTPNHRRKPFDDVRARRAITLALDRWNGSKYLSEIAIVRTVGGIVFPGDRLAASKEELQQLAGYWPDHKKSQEEAKRLLADAGVQMPLQLRIVNRAIDQPYRIVGIWVIDQLRQIGINAEQEVLPTGPFYDALRVKQDWDLAIEFNCQSNVNSLLDVSKFVSDDVSGSNYAGYVDRDLDRMFQEMNETADVDKQRSLMRAYERRILDEEARMFITLWWYRIIPHRSYVKGWKISPSHYLNQQLDNVWIDKSLM
ncbi:MAG: ABC transporter substrate-binding protein, partial [Alphaproteobacteria bacterium]